MTDTEILRLAVQAFLEDPDAVNAADEATVLACRAALGEVVVERVQQAPSGSLSRCTCSHCSQWRDAVMISGRRALAAYRGEEAQVDAMYASTPWPVRELVRDIADAMLEIDAEAVAALASVCAGDDEVRH